MRRYLFLIFCLVGYPIFFVLLGYRILVEKFPRDVILFTGILVSFFLGSKVLKYLIKSCITIYIKIRKAEKEESSKLVTLVLEKIKQVENFLEKDFFNKFLCKSKYISKFSLRILKLFEKYLYSTKKIYFIFLIIPWFIFLIIFFYELFTKSDLFICLYLFPINFLLKKLLDLILFILKNENKRLLYMVLEQNFPVFYYKHHTLREFFLVNRLIRCHYFFHEPKFQNKHLIVYFWNLFGELIYYNLRYRDFVDFLNFDCSSIKTFIYHINLIIFATSFLIFLNIDFFFLPDFFVVILIFISTFFAFTVFLKYLATFEDLEKNTSYKNYFSTLENIREFYEDSLFDLKTELLEKYSFLSEKDLNPFISPSVNDLHIARFQPYLIPLSLEDFEISLAVQKQCADWFFEQLIENNIDMNSFKYIPKEDQTSTNPSYTPSN